MRISSNPSSARQTPARIGINVDPQKTIARDSAPIVHQPKPVANTRPAVVPAPRVTSGTAWEQYVTPDWTLVIVTAFLVVVTAVLARYTYLLFYATKQMAGDARKTAEQQFAHTQKSIDIATAAADAAKTSADAYQHAERAWLSNRDVQQRALNDTPSYKNRPGQRSLGLSIEWINGGRTPAIECALYSTIAVVHPPFEEEPPTFERPSSEGTVKTTIVPGVPITGPTMLLTADQVDLLRHGFARVFLYVRADYLDVFSDRPRHTQSCMEMLFEGLTNVHATTQTAGSLPLQAGTPFFNYRIVGSQNSAS